MDGEKHLQMGDVGDVGMLACWPRHSPTPKYSQCVMVNPNFKLATYPLFILFPSMSRYFSLQIGQSYQWEFQDPEMEVLYHIRPYFVVIFHEN